MQKRKSWSISPTFTPTFPPYKNRLNSSNSLIYKILFHLIYTLEKRQSIKIGCPEEVSWRKNWITNDQLKKLTITSNKNDYGKFLREILLFEKDNL